LKDNRDLALGWLAKAESDLSAAIWMLGGEGPYDTACFHAQQAIEKA
jgi:HEPN domain-containing protein